MPCTIFHFIIQNHPTILHYMIQALEKTLFHKPNIIYISDLSKLYNPFLHITFGMICPISIESLSALWAIATGATLTSLCTSIMTDST